MEKGSESTLYAIHYNENKLLCLLSLNENDIHDLIRQDLKTLIL